MKELFIALLGFIGQHLELFIALFSALLGSIVGAIGTGWVTYHYTKKHALELERKQKIDLAKALRAEILTL